MRTAYLISNIEEYGKFISFCIHKDVSVFRSYWDERQKGKRCYCIDWSEKRCYYAHRSHYEVEGIPVVYPHFTLDQFGVWSVTPATPDKNKNENKE